MDGGPAEGRAMELWVESCSSMTMAHDPNSIEAGGYRLAESVSAGGRVIAPLLVGVLMLAVGQECAFAQVPQSVPWSLLSGDQAGGVDYKLKVNDACKLGGYSFYALRNRYGCDAQVYFLIHGADCDGKAATSSVSHNLKPHQTLNDLSTWFHLTSMTRIEIKKVYVKCLEDKQKHNDLIDSGNQFMQREEYDKAIAEFDRAYNYASTSEEKYEIGERINEAKRRKVDKIIEDLENKADAEFSKGNWGAAKSAYAKVLQIDPDNSYAKSRIKRCEEEIKAEQEKEKKEKEKKEKEKKDKEDGDKKVASAPAKTPEQLRIERLGAYRQESTNMHNQRWEQGQKTSREAQEAISNTVNSYADIIASGLASNTSENFWSDNSLHVGLSLGIGTGIIPLRVESRDYMERYDGNNLTVLKDERSQSYRTPAGFGFEVGMQFHPFISNYFGIGGYVDLKGGIGPGVLAGATTASAYTVTSTLTNRLFYYGLRYGAELWGSPIEWLRPILIYEEEIIGISFFEEAFTSSDDGFNFTSATRSTTSHTVNLLARNPHWGGGFRFLDLFGEATFDIVYLRSEMLDYRWGNTRLSFSRDGLIPANHKIRVGLWWQSHLRFDFTFGWEQLPVSNIAPQAPLPPTKWNEQFTFELRLRYTKNWFFTHR
jgi:tetratricopeptide (TPR) repeat protein